MANPDPSGQPAASVIERTPWRIDPARSRVGFEVPHFWGLVTIKGEFNVYEGLLDLRARPVIDLTIESDSLDTGNARRDKHLRSGDFFDVENHPQVRFVAETATLEGERLRLAGQLSAAGHTIPVEPEVTLRPEGDELEVQATAYVDQRQLGMTWSPLGMTRTPSKLILSGWLVQEMDLSTS